MKIPQRKTLFLLVTLLASSLGAQAPQSDRAAAGDSPDNPGPLANLSSSMTPRAINAAMVKVMDWQLAQSESRFNRLWTFAALYDGLLAASAATHHPEGHDAVLRAAERWQWQLEDTRFPHADDEALGQSYLDLYAEHPAPDRLAPTKAIMDRLAAIEDIPGKPVWWWCDALFMAPPVLVRLGAITHDPRYVATLDREWAVTKAALWSPQEHLYFRDARFLDLQAQHESNGKPVFWSRGNGWVIGGLVEILKGLPAADPHRAAYAEQFQQMMRRIAALQPADGLWRAGLLDADAYKMPEVSGSAFFAYGMAYGLRTGLLDEPTYRPVLERCWRAMVGHIYADGRLGSIQPIGFAPDAFTPASSYVYGVGAFLLAGSEIDQLLAQPAARHGKKKP